MPAPDHPLRDDVEEVRAYLTSVRGGAPFMSASDGHLLVTWLEAGVRVGAILRSIDRAADRRRAKRVRAPLTLRHARTFVEKEAARGATRVPVDLPARLLPDGAEDDPLAVSLAAARERIAALSEPDPELRARAACNIAREFFDRAWDTHPELRSALLAEAEGELVDLRDALEEAEYVAAVEDLARFRLRQRHPALSATRIWEECGLGPG